MPFPRHRFRKKRIEMGLTRAGLAELSGVTLRHLEKLEQGERPNPTQETLEALCKAMGVDCRFFFGADDAEGEPVPVGRPRKPAAEEPAAALGPKVRAKKKPPAG